MLFNSYIFIFLFLPLALVGYYFLNAKKRYEGAKIWLITMSLWFYAYFNLSYLLIILGSVAVNYLIYRAMGRTSETTGRKLSFVIGLFFNVGLLFYFKYYDFFTSNVNQLFREDFLLKNIVLPLGISFFTFQQISFVVDAYRKEVPQYSLIDYALFVTFFPQLIAGPIVTHAEMIPQFQDETKKNLDWERFAKGFIIFTTGLAKKVLIADTFGKAVDFAYEQVPSLNGSSAILVMFFYTIQLYFDFSGYCDMARGIGYFFNVEIPINFNSPYKAKDNMDFWKRWHITLNRFLTKYIYIPLGGSRKGAFRMYRNLFLVFLVSGIWHGANWTYILWGTLHGIMCILTKLNQKWIDRLPNLLTGAITFLFFNVSVVVFRAPSLEVAKEMLSKILSFEWKPLLPDIIEPFNRAELWYVLKITGLERLPYASMYCMIGFTVVAFGILFFGKNINDLVKEWKPRIGSMMAMVVLFVWSVLSLSGVSSFLYFNF